MLFAALPSDERHHLLALLARRLEHSDVGMLRRLTLRGGDQDGATYAWMMGALLAEVAPVTARATGARDGAPTTARACALIGLAVGTSLWI